MKKEKIEKNCLTCGKVFYVSPCLIRIKYCSRKCYYPVWAKTIPQLTKKPKLTKICSFCGKSFEVYPSWEYIRFCSNKCKYASPEVKKKISLKNRGRKLSPEHIEKLRLISKQFTGEKAHNWKGGKRIKKNERNDSAYQLWVSQIKKRDNNQCLFKGQNCFGYNIVHHILGWTKFPELRYELKNGITLCQYHHPRKRVEEQRLIPFFQEMVKSKESI